MLPDMKHADGIRTGEQTEFLGLNHNLGAGDGELWDMRNMTSDHYPLLASRPKRLLYKTLNAPGGLFYWEKLCWVDGDGFYYDGEHKGTVAPGEKTFASFGVYVIILPDKAYYNTYLDEFGSLESQWSGSEITFTNGRLFEEDAESNTICVQGEDWSKHFREGDAVTISGATQIESNNKTAIIREIDGDKLYFYEYVFRLDGDNADLPYTETGEMSIARTMPDLIFICENENRLWGCDDRTIYSSKLGDPFNWNVFDGLDTDSYAVDTGSAGNFTGCISYLGYPIFFKEDQIYKVYGSLPSNFQTMSSATLGVAPGSSRSLAIAGETLFYLSTVGIMAYTGGIPSPISKAFGTERHRGAVGGSTGIEYYVSMEGDNGTLMYVYDAMLGMWHIEDETRATYFARYWGNLYYLNDKGEIWITGNITHPPDEYEEEETVSWWFEFVDFTDDEPYKKGLSKILLRIELDEGAEAEMLIMYDSSGDWISVRKLKANRKRSYYIPVRPERADHYRIKVIGVGECRVYSLAREYYRGSANKSRPGRN
jgi:hypothetical protein